MEGGAQHFAMLPRKTHDWLDQGLTSLAFEHDRRHLDCLGASADDQQGTEVVHILVLPWQQPMSSDVLVVYADLRVLVSETEMVLKYASSVAAGRYGGHGCIPTSLLAFLYSTSTASRAKSARTAQLHRRRRRQLFMPRDGRHYLPVADSTLERFHSTPRVPCHPGPPLDSSDARATFSTRPGRLLAPRPP